MRLSAIVPIEEAFKVNNVANLESLNSLVCIAVCACEIILDNEGVGLAVDLGIEVKVAMVHA